jgi:hypothetical protein
MTCLVRMRRFCKKKFSPTIQRCYHFFIRRGDCQSPAEAEGQRREKWHDSHDWCIVRVLRLLWKITNVPTWSLSLNEPHFSCRDWTNALSVRYVRRHQWLCIWCILVRYARLPTVAMWRKRIKLMRTAPEKSRAQSRSKSPSNSTAQRRYMDAIMRNNKKLLIGRYKLAYVIYIAILKKMLKAEVWLSRLFFTDDKVVSDIFTWNVMISYCLTGCWWSRFSECQH